MGRLYAWDQPIVYPVIFSCTDHYHYKTAEALGIWSFKMT